MQVFAYEQNGDATFYTATGQLDGHSVTAPLMRYKGGRSMGGAMQDAVEDQSVGSVTVSFSNGLKGTVQFPGEPAVAIERFLVASDTPSVTNPRVQLGERTLRLFTLDDQGEPIYTTDAKLWRTDDGITHLDWRARRIVSGTYTNSQQFQCTAAPGKTRLTCLPLKSKSLSDLPEEFAQVESLELQFAGYDIQGSLHIGGAKPQAVTVLGFDAGAIVHDTPYREGITTYTPNQQQNYTYASFGYSGACTLTCAGATAANTFMPLNGTWIVADELTGKPGRGIALDIQGSTVILQIFNYRADGQPTFHMGSASYQSKGVDSRASVATIPLRQYRAGRSLGGPAQSAQLEADAGNAILEFNSPPPQAGGPDHNIWWSQGVLQLPGEAPVQIRRLQTDVPANFAEHMYGSWYVDRTDTVVRFDRADGNGVTTADGKIRCLPNSQSTVMNMSCGEPNDVMWNWHQFMYLPDMGRAQPFFQLRDRFGNSLGLGALN